MKKLLHVKRKETKNSKGYLAHGRKMQLIKICHNTFLPPISRIIFFKDAQNYVYNSPSSSDSNFGSHSIQTVNMYS